jgi:tetratricopeptide (TPR) repeat protein
MKKTYTLIIAAIISFNCFSQESDKAIDKALKFAADDEYEKADQVLSKLLLKEPGNTNALITRAEIRDNLDNVSGAWQDYASAVSHDPENSELTDALFNYTIRYRLYNDLIPFSSKIMSNIPNHAYPYYMRGYSQFALGNFQDAIKDFTKFLDFSISPELKASAYNLRANAFWRFGKKNEAIRDFNKALEEPSSRTTDIYNNLGYLYLKTNNPDSAIIAYTKSLELIKTLSSNNAQSNGCYTGIATGYSMKKDYTNALIYIEKTGYKSIIDFKINDPEITQILTELFVIRDQAIAAKAKEDAIKSCISGDCYNGFGIRKYTYSRYEGNWKDGKENGKGKMMYSDGRKYDGEWKDGKQNGKGIMLYSDGRKYDGEWKDGYQYGKGVSYFSDGSIEKNGYWNDDGFSGYGTRVYDNGKYVGNFVNSLMEGEGTFYWNDGDKYEGGWVGGERTGQGTLYWNDGTKHEGAWVGGKENGQGTYYYSDGDKYYGNFYNGNLSGYGTFVTESGQESSCKLIDGVIEYNLNSNNQPVYQYSQPARPNQITAPATFSPGLR